ncbi:MAG TPA: ACP S-malonyltransferase [Arenicellales bacterium]|nr:ACP S-malonyltransferase [Arenicellales bacterium]
MALAFVFPGQGSQSIGMLKALAESFAEVQETFEEASDALGYDLWSLTQNGPESELNRTEITQPAMLAAGVATWRVWRKQGGTEPQALAGHSLGEYAALVCAGSLGFAETAGLVAERGRLMQAAVPEGEGAMAAILGLDDATVESLCRDAARDQVVAAVNYNSPGQVVVAGNAAAVDRVLALASEAGAKRAIKLAVSAPSHCALMQSAAEKLAERLRTVEVEAPRIPVINNADVETPSDEDTIRAALSRQLYNPVRWVETVRRMAGEGVDRVVECGPGKVLAGLNKRIDRGMAVHPVYDPETLDKALAAIQESEE